MIVYYLLAVILVLVGCFLFPSAGKPIIATGFIAGVLLLIGVTVVTRRALRPLRAIRPDLTDIPASARAQLKYRRGGPAQPHYGAGGVFYVFMLVFMAAAGVITMTVSGASKATAHTQITISSCNYGNGPRETTCTYQWKADGRIYHSSLTGQFGTSAALYDPKHPDVVYDASTPYLNLLTLISAIVLILGLPGGVWGNVRFRNATRRPWLASLESLIVKAFP